MVNRRKTPRNKRKWPVGTLFIGHLRKTWGEIRLIRHHDELYWEGTVNRRSDKRVLHVVEGKTYAKCRKKLPMRKTRFYLYQRGAEQNLKSR